MKLWCWLNDNSGTLQSIAALLAAALTLGTIYVLWVTLNAIKRQATASELQAEAARALTTVAIEQTKAARDAAESAQKQCDMLSSQLEQSIAPLIVAEPDDREHKTNFRLVNRGKGVAFKVVYWKGGLEMLKLGSIPVEGVIPSTLAPGAFVYAPIPPAWDCFTIFYKGSDREMRWTVVHRDPRMAQEHVVQKGLQQFYLS